MLKLNQKTLDNIVNRLVLCDNIKGAVIYIDSSDRVLSLKSASGNIGLDSTYYIASINKLIISFITHRLCQNNKLKLSDKISRFLPQNIIDRLLLYKGIDYSNEITIAHLISHTSGLPDYLIDKRPDGRKKYGFNIKWRKPIMANRKSDFGSKKMNPIFRPSSLGKAHYSEVNFRLFDKILENVTKKNIQELMTSTI